MTATNGAPDPSRDTHFGFRTVGIDRKQAMVDDVFDKVAPRYDLMNDLMSGGLHRVWKDILATAVNPPRTERSFSALDVAGGTGDVAFRIAEAGGAGTRVTVCDINEEMLGVGRERAALRGLEGRVSFMAGNAESLPFPDRCDTGHHPPSARLSSRLNRKLSTLLSDNGLPLLKALTTMPDRMSTPPKELHFSRVQRRPLRALVRVAANLIGIVTLAMVLGVAAFLPRALTTLFLDHFAKAT